MNLLEAIQGAGENWFRPTGWLNSGMAYKLSGDSFVIMSPYTRQEYIGINLPASAIIGEWEIVTPEQVLSERK